MGTNHRVLPRILGTMAAFTLLLAAAVACGEAAAPSEPAPPPTIVPMVQATPAPTSAPGAPAATTPPTAAPQPTAMPTSAPEQASRSIIMVTLFEPESLAVHRRRGGGISNTMTDSLADRLTVFNWKTLEVDPHFAESWEQVAGDKWRFTIKEGISYHSGNIVTAEDYAWNLNWQVDPDNGARFNRYGVGMSAAAIDETTFEVSCENNCPVAPKLITHLHAGDPAGQSDPDRFEREDDSNGPYKLVDWSPGVSVTYEYFEDYWGPKPQITEVTWLWRGEASVRAAMIAVGEAHWAWDIENTNVDQVPKFISTESVETSAFIVDTRWNENTSNLQFRQALALAIDCETIVNNILGGQGTCRAVSYHPATTGHPDDLELWPYDPELARELIEQSGFAGSDVNVVAASGSYTKSSEMVEAVIGYWREVGLNANVKFVEPAIASQILRDIGGQPEDATEPPSESVPHMRLLGHTNDVIEPEASWRYANCTMYIAWSCFPDEFAQMQAAMSTPDPAERGAKLAEWHRWWRENLVHIPIHDIRPVYGMVDELEWEARPDWLLWPQFMRFTN